MIMEADNTQDLQGESASKKFRKANSVILVQVWRYGRLETQDLHMFQFEFEGRKRAMSQFRSSQAKENLSYSGEGQTFLFY